MFLSSTTDFSTNSPSFEWIKFKELCSAIISLSFNEFSGIFFLENNDSEVEAFFYNEAGNDFISFENALQNFNNSLFTFYRESMEKINKEKYPNHFTAWFYSQLKSSNSEIKPHFSKGKLITDHIKIKVNNYNITFFLELIFINQKVSSVYFEFIHKQIYFLKKCIDLPLKDIEKLTMVKLEKTVNILNRFFMYYEKEKIEDIIIKYMLEYSDEYWLIKLHQMKFFDNLLTYINDIILKDKNKIIDYILPIINQDFLEKKELLHFCCEHSKYYSALLLLEIGVGVDNKSSTGLTPLMISASKVDEKMVNILLNNHASVEIEDSYGIIASEKIPNFDFANDLFNQLEHIRKNKKGA